MYKTWLTVEEFDELMTNIGMPYEFTGAGQVFGMLTSAGGKNMVVVRVENDGIVFYRAGFYDDEEAQKAVLNVVKPIKQSGLALLDVFIIPTKEVRSYK